MTTVGDCRGLRILVVDDNLAIGRWLKFMLEADGAHVDVANSGPEAFVHLEKGHAFDLVLLDVRMPQCDGPATLCRMRQLHPVPLVVYMTGDMGEYTEEQLLASGGAGILAKPIDLAQLNEWLQRARATASLPGAVAMPDYAAPNVQA